MHKKEIKLKNPDNKYLKEYSDALKKGLKIVHVVPHEKGWAVKKILSRPSKTFSKKEDAISYASKLAVKNNSEYVTYSKNGQFQSRKSPK